MPTLEEELKEIGVDSEKWTPVNSAAPIVNGQFPQSTGSLPLQSQLDTSFAGQKRPQSVDLQIPPPSGIGGVNVAGANAAAEVVNKVLPGVLDQGIVYPATLDSIANSPGAAQGNGSSKVNSTAVNANPNNGAVGAIAPAQSGVLSQGSTPLSIQATPFSYTATTTTMTISWTGVIVLRGSDANQPLPNGSITITGLTAGTNYYFYPYLNDLALEGAVDYRVVSWLAYVDASNVPVGAPAIAYTAPSAVLGQQSGLQGLVSLVGTYLEFATPASGSGGGSGGGDGGTGGGKGNTFD